MKYVYEVISTNIHNGNKDSYYFDSQRAADRWKESRDRNGMFVSEIVKWNVYGMKDI